MLAMQSSTLPPNVASASNNASGNALGPRTLSTGQIRPNGSSDNISNGANTSSTGGVARHQEENAQEKLRRLMDLPATDDLEWTRQDR